MLLKCTFKITYCKPTHILTMWPFALSDLGAMLNKIPLDFQSFIAVNHPQWPDGFHPPSISAVSGLHKSGQKLAMISNKRKLIRTIEMCQLRNVVDFKIFSPRSKISNNREINLLQQSFNSSDDNIALKKFGGFWLYVHDNCKTYISLNGKPQLFRLVLQSIFSVNNESVEQKIANDLFKRLLKIPNNKCLIATWFNDFFKVHEKPSVIQRFEKYGYI